MKHRRIIMVLMLILGALPFGLAADETPESHEHLSVAASVADEGVLLSNTTKILSLHSIRESHKTIDFGDVRLRQSHTDTLTLINTNSATLTIYSLAVSGDSYSLRGKSIPTRKHPAELATGDKLDVIIRVQPEQPGACTGQLIITTKESPNKPFVQNLTVTGMAAYIHLSENTIDFGKVRVGETVLSTITLTNVGTTPLFMTRQDSPEDNFNLGEFLALSWPDTLQPSEEAELKFSFSPRASRDYSTTVSFLSNAFASETIAIALSGSGIRPEIVYPARLLDFGPVRVNEARSIPIAIANAGTDTLIIQQMYSNEFQFKLDNEAWPIFIPEGDSATFNLDFTPNTESDFGGLLTILSNDIDESELNIPIVGQGVLPDIDVPIRAYEFGEVASSDEWMLEMGNTGQAPLKITSISSSNRRFRIIENTKGEVTLQPGEQYAVPVIFKPQAGDIDVTSTIKVVSNDPDESVVHVTVSGSVLTSRIHLVEFTAVANFDLVTLSWEFEPMTHDVAALNVYRAEGDSTGNRVHIKTLPQGESLFRFSDLDVNARQTYFYWLEIVKQSGSTTLYGPVVAQSPVQPDMILLHQNYPNPFYDETQISYELPASMPISLTVYNMHGQLVKSLVETVQGPGFFTASWDGLTEEGEEVAGGIYFFRLEVGEQIQTRRMTYLR